MVTMASAVGRFMSRLVEFALALVLVAEPRRTISARAQVTRSLRSNART